MRNKYLSIFIIFLSACAHTGQHSTTDVAPQNQVQAEGENLIILADQDIKSVRKSYLKTMGDLYLGTKDIHPMINENYKVKADTLTTITWEGDATTLIDKLATENGFEAKYSGIKPKTALYVEVYADQVPLNVIFRYIETQTYPYIKSIAQSDQILEVIYASN